ncbi:hypothetical protein I8D64_07850 [Brachybacterium sp. MASK1Z-5]|uniref:ATPase n=1 Tax=Brachybacterium halotolerans TaxID=2795215 RepID=A0ABS1B9I1_9MICO|nr:hypothetical protein [Brachybacterium halotolerans]MBK0331314.1 hypothetical protein [Brachybacterium halotolerans]
MSSDSTGTEGAHAVDIDARIRDLPVRAEIADDTLILEVDIAGTEEQLWRAITDPEQLARWSPVVPDRRLTEVGPALSRETPDEDPVAADVLATAGQHALTHRWGDATMGWMIEEGRLDIQVGLPDVQQAQYFAAGWQVCLAVLDAQLSGLDQERIVGMDAMDHGWEELRARYAEEFGHPDGESPEA